MKKKALSAFFKIKIARRAAGAPCDPLFIRGAREGAGEKRELKPYECFSGRLAQNGVLKCEKNSEVGPPAAADAREAWPDGGTPSVAGGGCTREKALSAFC